MSAIEYLCYYKVEQICSFNYNFIGNYSIQYLSKLMASFTEIECLLVNNLIISVVQPELKIVKITI